MAFKSFPPWAKKAIDYHAVFTGTEDGKRVMKDLMLRNFIAQTTIVAGDAQLTAFNEGRRAAVLDIMGLVGRGVDPEKFVREMNEASREYKEGNE